MDPSNAPAAEDQDHPMPDAGQPAAAAAGGTASAVEAPQDGAASQQPEKLRRPKKPYKKWMMLIGYCGTGYRGMQWNPPYPTIEAEITKVIDKLDLVADKYKGGLNRSDYSRVARTDKGVHAAGQIIALKLLLADDEAESVREAVNRELPPTIRVHHMQRVTKFFNARKACDARVYEYLLPTFVLKPKPPKFAMVLPPFTVPMGNGQDPEPVKPPPEQDAQFVRAPGLTSVRASVCPRSTGAGTSRSLLLGPPIPAQATPPGAASTLTPCPAATGCGTYLQGAQDGWKRRAQWLARTAPDSTGYRADAASVQRLRDAAAKLIGNHSFHNFTPLLRYGDAMVTRSILSIDVSEPFLVSKAGRMPGVASVEETAAEQTAELRQKDKGAKNARQRYNARKALVHIDASVPEQAIHLPPRSCSCDQALIRKVEAAKSGSLRQAGEAAAAAAGGGSSGQPAEDEMIEFVRVTLVGRSFVLNHIRHMIGCMVDVARGMVPMWMVELALGKFKVETPLAPAEGLFLLEAKFGSYNRRYPDHAPVDTAQHPEAAARSAAFKEQYIWAHIARQVAWDCPFEQWLLENNTQRNLWKVSRITDTQDFEAGVSSLQAFEKRRFTQWARKQRESRAWVPNSQLAAEWRANHKAQARQEFREWQLDKRAGMLDPKQQEEEEEEGEADADLEAAAAEAVAGDDRDSKAAGGGGRGRGKKRRHWNGRGFKRRNKKGGKRGRSD